MLSLRFLLTETGKQPYLLGLLGGLVSDILQSPCPCLAQGERPLSEAILTSQEHPVPSFHPDLTNSISRSPSLSPRRLRPSFPCLQMKTLRLREGVCSVFRVPPRTLSTTTRSLCCSSLLHYPPTGTLWPLLGMPLPLALGVTGSRAASLHSSSQALTIPRFCPVLWHIVDAQQLLNYLNNVWLALHSQ